MTRPPWEEPEPEEAVAGATRRKPRRRRATRRRGARVPGPDLVGRDFAKPARHEGRRPRPRLLAPLVSGALAGLLLLAALHLDLIRLQYALGQALRTETALRDAKGQRVVDERGQRDPAELRERAEAMGLGVAERVITLPPIEAAEADPWEAEAPEARRLAVEIGR
ncbi:MAG: hypothetical protein QNK05_01540 [Myxococcota bacterium]|nr:hypothetical protein [Myxococcota bacterium]